MNIAVTGGAGFIGSHIVEFLIKKGFSVTVIDNLHSGNKENLKLVKDKIDFIQNDIRDLGSLKKVFKNIDGVFHEAALASVQESFSKPDEYHDVNVNGTENIFKLAKEFKFKIVFASSSSVYGNLAEIPIKEDSPKRPINPYAQNKLDEELIAEKYTKLGVDIIGLRYFNVFGERQSENYAGVIKKFLKNIQEGKPLIINGDGLQVRDFVHVDDVVRANLTALESNVKNAFINIGTGITTSVVELANQIINSSGLSLKPIHSNTLEGDVRASQADISLAKKLLNWEPKIKLKDWLNETVSKIKNKTDIL